MQKQSSVREEVILVNEKDEALGVMEKLEAHQKGLLHRAFSVFVFNDRGELLLQQRAYSKYHSGGLWTNTCCSHPRPGEDTLAAANRRLMEEMGFQTPLLFKTSFVYKTPFDNQLTEHEFDHVFTGVYNHDPVIDPNEVERFKWATPEAIKTHMTAHPEAYTSWFCIAMQNIF